MDLLPLFDSYSSCAVALYLSQQGFKILPVPNKQSGMKCIQFLTNNEEYALKAINEGSQWKLVFEVSNIF